jgi:hypothetical protein
MAGFVQGRFGVTPKRPCRRESFSATVPPLLYAWICSDAELQEVQLVVCDAPRYVSPFLDTAQAAEFLHLSPRTLEKHRWTGGGPRFRKFGSRVFYAVADLQIWADEHVYANTSESTSIPSEQGP